MDLNVMLQEQARTGLQRELDKAVEDGDAEAARKASEKLAQLAVATAPKPAAGAYGDAEIKAELAKNDWFGKDPKKSARAVELGKHMDPKKFANAAEFAAALVKAVEDDLKPASAAPAAGGANDDDDEDEDDKNGEGEEDDDDEPPARQRRSDGPRDGDTGSASRAASRGPWAKLSDAPGDVRKEIQRQADKFVPSNAPKGQRETFIKNALASHYNAHQQRKGKK